MFMADMPVASALGNSDVGIVKFLVETLTPIFGGMNEAVFTICFVLMFGLVSQVSHNAVLAAIMPPIIVTICTKLGADPQLITVLFAMAISMAAATPGASANAALIFSNTQWIDTKAAYSDTAIIVAIGRAFTILIGYPLGSIFF